MIVAFRRHTLLPLDDCLYALQPSLPHLTRSSLHRRLQRHGIARLPETGGTGPERPRLRAHPAGFFHIDIAEAHAEEGRLRLFVAADRTSNFAFARLRERATRRIAADVPCRIHTVLTDDGTRFADRMPSSEEAEAAAEAYRGARRGPHVWRVHAFNRACEKRGIGHRTTKPAHPWTDGQVEGMNRALEDAAIRRQRHGGHDELRHHLRLLLAVHNHARRLETPRGLTRHEFTCKAWTERPSRFTSGPTHYTLGPNAAGAGHQSVVRSGGLT